MKMRALFFILSVVCLAGLWSCVTLVKSSDVVSDPFGIVILPTDFGDDQKNIDDILSKYDEGLYRIITPKGVKGTLKDIYTNRELAACIEKGVNSEGFTSSAGRVGHFAFASGITPPGTIGPAAKGGNSCGSGPQNKAGRVVSGTNPNYHQQVLLIKELKPILEKHRCKQKNSN